MVNFNSFSVYSLMSPKRVRRYSLSPNTTMSSA